MFCNYFKFIQMTDFDGDCGPQMFFIAPTILSPQLGKKPAGYCSVDIKATVKSKVAEQEARQESIL